MKIQSFLNKTILGNGKSNSCCSLFIPSSYLNNEISRKPMDHIFFSGAAQVQDSVRHSGNERDPLGGSDICLHLED